MTARFLAEFEMYVMLAVARLGDDAYGARVRDEIEERAGRPVSIGALYATLLRMERSGFVTGRWQEREDGERRRIYELPVLVDLTALEDPEALP